MSKTNDARSLKALKNGKHSFVDEKGNTFEWNINGILGFGASGIVYDVSNPEFPSKHYALKEYFPFSLLHFIDRTNDELIIDENERVVKTWNIGLENFKKESKFQSFLPASNTEYGNYFMYAINSFIANKTAYIVLDTENCLTLHDHINVAFSFKDDKKKSFSFIKEMLKYHIDICTAISFLHKNGFLHLDISPSNIMINEKANTARLNDFASAVEYNVEQATNELMCSLSSYTDAYSPIEQKSIVLGNRKKRIEPATDVYSICAVLYKSLFNDIYDPVRGIDENCFEIPLCPYLSKTTANRIIQLLAKGLCGIEYRIKSAEELKNGLQQLLSIIESEEEKEKLKSLSLAPSVSLAIGYYENFLQDVICEMLRLQTITVNGKGYDVSKCKKEFLVLLPKDICGDWKSKAEDYYGQKGFLKFTFEKFREIGLILDYAALYRKKVLRFIDIPQTLRSSFKAIDFIAKNNNTNDTEKNLHDKEREVESFINTISNRAKDDAIVNSLLSIKRINI